VEIYGTPRGDYGKIPVFVDPEQAILRYENIPREDVSHFGSIPEELGKYVYDVHSTVPDGKICLRVLRESGNVFEGKSPVRLRNPFQFGNGKRGKTIFFHTPWG
jgi:hypothetical protein